MQKAGGLFSIFAAGATLFVGSLGWVYEAAKASTVAALGWSGILFSVLIILLGAIATETNSRKPGVLLILCSLAGALLGGTLVSIFMLLALVGGILAVIGVRKKQPDTAQGNRPPSKRDKRPAGARPPMLR